MMGILKALLIAGLGTAVFFAASVLGFIVGFLGFGVLVFVVIFGLVRLDQVEQAEAAHEEKNP